MAHNKYTTRFAAKCPNNDQVIVYELNIESDMTIMVEDITSAVASLPAMGYHEELAELLSAELPGIHTLKAHHHGVDIETRRGD